MTIDEIIRHTRIFSEDAEKLMLPPGLKELLIEAAERLEKLEERPDIVRCKDCKYCGSEIRTDITELVWTKKSLPKGGKHVYNYFAVCHYEWL